MTTLRGKIDSLTDDIIKIEKEIDLINLNKHKTQISIKEEKNYILKKEKKLAEIYQDILRITNAIWNAIGDLDKIYQYRQEFIEDKIAELQRLQKLKRDEYYVILDNIADKEILLKSLDNSLSEWDKQVDSLLDKYKILNLYIKKLKTPPLYKR